MDGPQRGGAWKLDRGGFAEASELRRGFAKTFHRFWQKRRALPVVFLSSPIIFRQSDCNLPVDLSEPSHTKHQPLACYCHESTQHTCHEST